MGCTSAWSMWSLMRLSNWKYIDILMLTVAVGTFGKNPTKIATNVEKLGKKFRFFVKVQLFKITI